MTAFFNLTGKTALVTGASRGIGHAIALGLARAGANVIVHYVGNREKAEATAVAIRELGVQAAVVCGDLSVAGAARRIYEDGVAALGAPDIVVLNASVQIRKPWAQITAEEFDQQVNANFRASLELMQLAIPAMAARHWGRVLAIGSIQEARPHRDMAVYAATKSAQESMVRNIAAQVAAQGITVNNLAPGVIATDRNTEALANAEYRQQILNKIPMRVEGMADDCTGAAVLLCSDAGRYITGITLFVDGGMHL